MLAQTDIASHPIQEPLRDVAHIDFLARQREVMIDTIILAKDAAVIAEDPQNIERYTRLTEFAALENPPLGFNLHAEANAARGYCQDADVLYRAVRIEYSQ